ncbi:hypothetical protein RFI_32126 [Reticulomyxa filosa]|uniref:Uncharacterized protein n=1 Tax=Reticulomyxa filosa TaxID=46433 RepID=X6LX07_RETFI|nr:hypothetical protein RFI_32126 [Reticulomyxa filosa]|eukprot:ETO05270.1 hypothetical protein RFI_32126 [Reticulomyxa filosa]
MLNNNNRDSNETTLLSFGGDEAIGRHTLVMKYVSVWRNNNKITKLKKSNISGNYNEWIPFTDNHNNPIQIGKKKDNYKGARAVIGGSNNHLLFITYYPKNISVFDLNTFRFIKHDHLSICYNRVAYHCFVLKSESEQVVTSTNEKKK